MIIQVLFSKMALGCKNPFGNVARYLNLCIVMSEIYTILIAICKFIVSTESSVAKWHYGIFMAFSRFFEDFLVFYINVAGS